MLSDIYDTPHLPSVVLAFLSDFTAPVFASADLASPHLPSPHFPSDDFAFLSDLTAVPVFASADLASPHLPSPRFPSFVLASVVLPSHFNSYNLSPSNKANDEISWLSSEITSEFVLVEAVAEIENTNVK